MTATFEDGVTRLNRRSLHDALTLCSALAALELYSPRDSDVFPMLNLEKSRLFAEAILASNSLAYKDSRLTQEDFRQVINATADAINDPRLLVDIPNHAERSLQLYGASKVFSRMANIQLRAQESSYRTQMGRLLATLEVWPSSNPKAFPDHIRTFACAMPTLVRTILGASITELLLTHTLISIWQRRLSDACWAQVGKHSRTSDPDSDRRQANLIWQLIETTRGPTNAAVFTSSSISGLAAPNIPAHQVDALLSLEARPIPFTRSVASKDPAYSFGPPGLRLSPLERYPIVDMGVTAGQQTFLVPNARVHRRALPDILHFALLERMPPTSRTDYDHFRGAAQETYITEMLRSQLPDLDVVPECEYKRHGLMVKGADHTILDKASRALIMVESKARRASAETRFTLEEGTFDLNFADVYKALASLPDKIADVKAGMGDYAAIAGDLSALGDVDCICVCVVGDAVYFINELVRYRASREADHPLHNLKLPFCIMSIDMFENAVAVSATTKEPLGDILRAYWSASDRTDLSSPAPDHFGGRELHSLNTFGKQCLSTYLGSSAVLPAVPDLTLRP